MIESLFAADGGADFDAGDQAPADTSFSLLSNTSKSMHDTAKAIILSAKA